MSIFMVTQQAWLCEFSEAFTAKTGKNRKPTRLLSDVSSRYKADLCNVRYNLAVVHVL